MFGRKELDEAVVFALVDAIRRDTLDEPGAGAEVDRLLRRVSSSGLRGLATVIDALDKIGQTMQRQVPRAELEPEVLRCINLSPTEKSEAATAAVNELGRALFLGERAQPLLVLLAVQGGDSRLSEAERSENLLNLTFAAGWIAAVTKTTLPATEAVS